MAENLLPAQAGINSNGGHNRERPAPSRELLASGEDQTGEEIIGQDFVVGVVKNKFTPALEQALKLKVNREMLAFELGKAFDKVVARGFKPK